MVTARLARGQHLAGKRLAGKRRHRNPRSTLMSKRHSFEYTGDFDCRLMELVGTHGKKWRLIAKKLGSVASEDAIRNRYIRLAGITRASRASRSSACNTDSRKSWSEEEDRKLARAVNRFGFKWDYIRTFEFPQRSRQALRNRAYRMGLDLLLFM